MDSITALELALQQPILTKLNDISTQLTSLQSASCALPDLVPLPTPASTPPEGFCRRNDQGQLLVNVYNQGGANAVASTTRVVFNCADPTQCVSRSGIVVDVATPALAASSGIDLAPIDIPLGCFDPTTLNCSFRIGVDVNGVVIELNETNNNAAGVCGPQFQ
jgi:subtilase family serine protease